MADKIGFGLYVVLFIVLYKNANIRHALISWTVLCDCLYVHLLLFAATD